MIAIARVLLEHTSLEGREKSDVPDSEMADLRGEPRDDWEAAKAAVEIPAGAQLIAWIREE